MKIEIEDIREVKEVVIDQDGNINSKFPKYQGHIAKVVILNEKRKGVSSHSSVVETVETYIGSSRVEGKRYVQGQKRSRKSSKDFVRLITNSLDVDKKTQSWIFLKNGIQIRYASSVVYDGADGDFLWYSLSYDDISEKLKKNPNTFLAFVIRDSKMVMYVRASDIIEELKGARDLRKNDWIHLHIIFSEGNIKLQLKTGKDNEPIEKNFNRNEHYVSWNNFTNIVRGESR